MSEITPNTPNPVREDAYKQQLAAKLGIDPQYIPGSPIWHSEEEIAAIAEMFSNMAGGSSGGGVLVVHDANGTLDKTWQEIRDADYPVVVREDNMLGAKFFYGVAGVLKGDVDLSMPYGVALYNFGNGQTINFSTPSASGYPAYTE